MTAEHYKKRYRVTSTRLPGWDYRYGWYFITICARAHEVFFGMVEGEQMRLSPIGKVVAEEWLRTAEVRPNIVLDAWVVMPNHVHAIIGINVDRGDIPGNTLLTNDGIVETPRTAEEGVVGKTMLTNDGIVETPRRGVSTMETNENALTRASRNANMAQRGGHNPAWQSGSLGAIVGQFKSIVTKRVRAAGFAAFAWQQGYYDRCIRSEKAFLNIRRYIQENPTRWEFDTLYQASLRSRRPRR
ncbi:MAG: hypothetical protein MUD01_11795 [Chloroflexaceae bacterium]|nr:hypothetical protein [Chloroflexaceae bacterium]